MRFLHLDATVPFEGTAFFAFDFKRVAPRVAPFGPRFKTSIFKYQIIKIIIIGASSSGSGLVTI